MDKPFGEEVDLQRAVEAQHGGTATLAQTVPVHETFNGQVVWDGTVHVFDLADNSRATRAYAWSSPIEGSDRRRFYAVLHLGGTATHRQSYRHAVNAIFALDAAVGIAFWHLHDLGDPRGNGEDDARYRNHLADLSLNYRIVRDTAFALKHGRLMRPANPSRLASDAGQLSAEVRTLSGPFRLNVSGLGGDVVNIDSAGDILKAASIITDTLSFLEAHIADLPNRPSSN